MGKSSHSFRMSATLLSLTGILLVGCSQPRKPDPPPQVVQCPPPLVDVGLMTPPDHQAIDRLLKTLGMPPVSVVALSSDSPHSKPSSNPN